MLAAAGDTQQVYDSDIKLIPPHELDSKKTQTYRRFWVRSTTDRYHLHAGLTRFETGDFRTPDFPILESAKFCVTSMYDQVWSRRRGLFKNRIDLVDSWIIFIQRHQSKLIKCYDRALTVNRVRRWSFSTSHFARKNGTLKSTKSTSLTAWILFTLVSRAALGAAKQVMQTKKINSSWNLILPWATRLYGRRRQNVKNCLGSPVLSCVDVRPPKVMSTTPGGQKKF